MNKKIIEKWHEYYAGKNLKNYRLDGCSKSYKGISLGMAKVISQSLATLVWSNIPRINTVGEDIENSQLLIDSVLDSNKVWDIIPRKLELMAADGGFMCVAVPTENGTIIDYYDVSKFNILEWHNDNIKKIELINSYTVNNNNKVLTVVITETHDYTYKSYKITNKATIDGMSVSLSFIRPDLEAEHEYTEIDEPFFTYFKSPLANNIDIDSPYGISIYANALDTLDSVDHAYTHKKRDITKAQTRLFISENALTKSPVESYQKSLGTFSPESDDAITVINSDPGDSKLPIDAVVVSMKTDDLIKCINKDLETLCMQTGFSPGSFTFDGASVKTATEVIYQQSDTYKLKSKFENVVETCLISLCKSILKIDEITNKSNYGVTTVTIGFKSTVSNDKSKDISDTASMVNNKFMSRCEAIMSLRGITRNEALEVMLDIAKEELDTIAFLESNKKVEV